MDVNRSVSIIIPVYNEEATLPALLAALDRQTYPKHLMQVIVIDNNSTDRSADIARQAGVVVLEEKRQASSDLARNTGIAYASGEILAFTDGDCRPDPQWLSTLIAAIPHGKKVLAAGRILLELPSLPTGGQIYDSMSFLNHENSVRFRKIAFTANLAVARETALAVGGIPMGPETCGDSYFARLCYHHGCDMVYVADAVVRHPTRKFSELLSKAKLIARANGRAGDPDLLVNEPRRDGYAKGWRSVMSMPHLRALNPFQIYRHLRQHGIPVRPSHLVRAWSVAVLTLTWGVLTLGIARWSH